MIRTVAKIVVKMSRTLLLSNQTYVHNLSNTVIYSPFYLHMIQQCLGVLHSFLFGLLGFSGCCPATNFAISDSVCVCSFCKLHRSCQTLG